MKTKVHFRKYPAGDIIALFPELPHDRNGHYCVSYQHVGQHGAASPEQPNTVPATAEESATLAAELARIGYDLQPVARITAQMHRNRRLSAATS